MGFSKPKFNSARKARDYLSIVQNSIPAIGATYDFFEARHVGSDGRGWSGGGSDNDHGECCYSGEERYQLR
jgi:hypothetical protein